MTNHEDKRSTKRVSYESSGDLHLLTSQEYCQVNVENISAEGLLVSIGEENEVGTKGEDIEISLSLHAEHEHMESYILRGKITHIAIEDNKRLLGIRVKEDKVNLSQLEGLWVTLMMENSIDEEED